MSNDDVPLPTNKKRRSIFDENDEQEDVTGFNLPVEKSELYYPIEYVEKLKTETEVWNMHVIKVLEEKHKFKAEKKELQNTVIDEDILSKEQIDILNSFNMEEYMRRATNFLDRFEIIKHKMQYRTEKEIENRYVAVQSKLEKELIMKPSLQEH